MQQCISLHQENAEFISVNIKIFCGCEIGNQADHSAHTEPEREYFTFSHHSHSNITFYLLGMLPSDQNENEGARFNFKNVQIRANFFEELM